MILKAYNSLDNWYKEKFNSKVVKVSLDAGFSCPNKDGTVGVGGCIFCNGTVLIGDLNDPLRVQFDKTIEVLRRKYPNAKFIPFLESNTNTYGDIEKIKKIFQEIMSFEDIVGISIATRCDSISKEAYDYLEYISKQIFLTVELGLQSCHDRTLKLINRGHTVESFTNCIHELKKRGIHVVVHIINGLPYETESDMIETINYINYLKVDGIKFHMLFIEKGTDLEKLYQKKKFHILAKDEYIRILAQQISLLDPSIVIHRLFSGPNCKLLVEPGWLIGKFRLLNEINSYMKKNDIYQGKYFEIKKD